MVLKNKYIFFSIGIMILIVLIVSIYFFQHSKPESIIENSLKISLPPSCKIINYTHSSNNYGFTAKILVEMQYIDKLKKQIGNSSEWTDNVKYPDNINFKNTCEWWDLDKANIESLYYSVTSGRNTLFGSSPKSIFSWIFISKDISGQYYLYVTHF